MTDAISVVSAQPAEETVDTAELAKVMRSRAKTYGMLARMYRKEVDADFIAELRGMRFPTSTGNEHADLGYRMLYGYLARAHEDIVLDLARDYVRSFIGHGVNGHSAAYPFESVHTSERRLLMQEARAEVLAIYRANNLKKDPSWKDCEDHIALELEFMQVMADRTAQALERDDVAAATAMLQTQRAFVRNHLANWVPILAGEIKLFAQTDFYLGLVELTLGFVQIEVETLDDLLEDEE